MFQKILVAVDESPLSQQAFEQALIFGRSMSAQLMLVHVQTPFETPYPNQVFPFETTYPTTNLVARQTQVEAWQVNEERGLQLLKQLVEQAIAAGVNTQSTQPLGNPGQTICDTAKTWGADLVIIGRRGHTGLDELLVGSVSNYVMHHAPCSVLTVQGQ